jgi:hypothetical protein
MGPQVFHKSRSHLNILGAIRVKLYKFRTEDLQILGAITQNLATRATWRPGFVHPWSKTGRCHVHLIIFHLSAYRKIYSMVDD